MAASESKAPSMTARKVVDMVLGAAVMGTVGTLIGMILGRGSLPVAVVLGLALGIVVGLLGGRRFLVSILIGAVSGGILAWALVGMDGVTVGAGAGAAMGGFLGIQISMLLDLRAQRKSRTASVGPPA
jgi:uncharacterized protein YcfJ